jgi:uncharacterized protein
MQTLNTELQQKLTDLQHWFQDRQGSIVAFSGGIDSTLVLYLARKFQGKDRAIGVISNSESLKQKDFKLAQDFCREFDITLEVIKTNELEDERYNENPINRCFFCKEHLFTDLTEMQTYFVAGEQEAGETAGNTIIRRAAPPHGCHALRPLPRRRRGR